MGGCFPDNPRPILPLFLATEGGTRLPSWWPGGVAVFLEGDGAALGSASETLAGRIVRRGPAVFIGDPLLSALLAQSWHSAEFLAYLKRLSTSRRVRLDPQQSAALRSVVADADADLRARRPAMEALAIARIVELIVVLYRAEASGGVLKAGECAMARLATYIQEHYSESLTLEGLAEQCALSPTHLSHTFRETMGRPLFAYINEVRIDRACGLLKRSSMSVVEIAYAVGYNSLSFFNRYFRRLNGLSPTEYRRNIGREGRNIVVED